MGERYLGEFLKRILFIKVIRGGGLKLLSGGIDY